MRVTRNILWKDLSQRADADKPAVRPPSPWKQKGMSVLGSGLSAQSSGAGLRRLIHLHMSKSGLQIQTCACTLGSNEPCVSIVKANGCAFIPNSLLALEGRHRQRLTPLIPWPSS